MRAKIFRKIIDELWDEGKIPCEQVETIHKILDNKLEIDLERRWNISRLTYTKKYYEERIKELGVDK